jgi:excisionase family DNA binding protein
MPHLSDLPEWASPKEVAAVLQVSRRTVTNWLQQPGDPMPGVRGANGVRARWLIPREELIAWIHRRSNSFPPTPNHQE